MSTKRARQVADLIHRNLAILLKREVSDPRLVFVSITSVDLSPDLGNAKIYFALPDQKQLPEVQKAFASASGYLRSLLADGLGLRYVPKLHFVFDKSIDQGAKMSDLIEQARRRDEQLRRDDSDEEELE